MPRRLTRDDLWVVKMRDGTMKQMLLRMVEWHTIATKGTDTDTWYIGTKMKRWVDAATWEELRHMFGHFDRQDSWRTLVAMMRVLTRLTHETADRLGHAWPEQSERQITQYVLGLENEFAGE